MRIVKIFTVLLVFVLGLAGCMKNPPIEFYQAQIEQAKAEAKQRELPLASMTGPWKCDDPTCSWTIYRPNPDALPEIQEGHTQGVVATHAIGATKEIVKWGAGTYVLGQAIRKIGDETTTITGNKGDVTFTKDNVSIESTKVGTDMIGDTTNTSIDTDTTNTSTATTTNTSTGDYSGDNSGSVGDYSGTQAGNQGTQIDDNRGRIESPDNDSTHEPTVVTQPAPKIVTQPTPVVVQ